MSDGQERQRLFYDPNSLSSFNSFRIVDTFFDWKVDFDATEIDGSVRFDVQRLKTEACERSTTIVTENGAIPNQHENQFVLDARQLTIKRVVRRIGNESTPLEFRVDSERESMIIDLNPTGDEALLSIEIFYSTSNSKCSALQWLSKEQTADRQYPYMFSQCQAIHGRSLYPCQDTPGVKSTYSAKVTCPKPLTVVSLFGRSSRSIGDFLAFVAADERTAHSTRCGNEHVLLRTTPSDSFVSVGDCRRAFGIGRSKSSDSCLDRTIDDSTVPLRIRTERSFFNSSGKLTRQIPMGAVRFSRSAAVVSL